VPETAKLGPRGFGDAYESVGACEPPPKERPEGAAERPAKPLVDLADVLDVPRSGALGDPLSAEDERGVRVDDRDAPESGELPELADVPGRQRSSGQERPAAEKVAPEAGEIRDVDLDPAFLELRPELAELG
jgi:hypothetical protein